MTGTGLFAYPVRVLLRAPNFFVDDRFETVLEFCRVLNDIWHLGPSESWRLDLRNCGYLGPDAAALIYSTYLRGREIGQKAEVLLPDAPPKLAAFCQFSGLRHYIEHGPRPRQDHPESETLPLSQFYQVIGNQSAPIVALVRRHMDLSADNEVYLSAAFQEVVQNVEDHADSPIGGISCGRFFSGSNEVRVALVDRGVGFAGSLSRHHGAMSATDALKRILLRGESGKSRPNNMGLGLNHLASFVRNLQGELVVVTHDGSARLTAGHDTFDIRQEGISFPGTAVFFRMNLGVRVDG